MLDRTTLLRRYQARPQEARRRAHLRQRLIGVAIREPLATRAAVPYIRPDGRCSAVEWAKPMP